MQALFNLLTTYFESSKDNAFNSRFSLTWESRNKNGNLLIQKESGKWKKIKYAKSLAKNRVYAIVHMWDIQKKVLPKFITLCKEMPCLCPFQGHKYGRRKTTETSVVKFSSLCVNSSLEELTICNVFNPHESFPSRQLNAVLHKSLEIQPPFIAKQTTLLNRKFVCLKVLRCSNTTWK